MTIETFRTELSWFRRYVATCCETRALRAGPTVASVGRTPSLAVVGTDCTGVAWQSKLILCRLFSPFPIPCRHARSRCSAVQCSEWSECSLVRESAMGIGTAERGGTGGGRRRQGGGRKEGDEKGDGGNGTERRSSFAINTFHVQLQSQSRAPFVPFRSIPVQALKSSPESIDGVETELAGWLAGWLA